MMLNAVRKALGDPVVEVQPRRRIFVPISRVMSIDAGQVIIHGTVNLRRRRHLDATADGDLLR